MRVLVGTSGYSYPEWKGSFYPQDLPAKKMLRYYAERFPTVEANNTFYKMPSPAAMTAWLAEVPASFVFGVKAPQRITHKERLVDSGASLDFFLTATTVLGAQRGPLLFQLPPFQKKDVERLKTFCALIPKGVEAAFEFRHTSWFEPDVLDALRSAGQSLVISESEKLAAPVEATASWGYLRLRREDYVDADLVSWSQKIKAQKWSHCYVYFKHEDAGVGPKYGKRLIELLPDQTG
jgi:uncharacterized protein YecE (DUF72 family)